MRVIITGGGTGGHIYPAIAIMNEIKKNDPTASFLYIGTDTGLEKDIISKLDIPFSTIDIMGFKRKLSTDNFDTIIKFFGSVKLSKKYIKNFNPDVVIGTGGYVCGPVLFAASRLEIPTFIHEQNIIPGLTNKFLTRYVDVIGVSFSGSMGYFKDAKRVVLTGNPCASEAIKASKDEGYKFLNIESSKKTVLIFGGSRGAEAINNTFVEVLPDLKKYEDFHFVFVTGKVHFNAIKDKVDTFAKEDLKNLSIFPYLYNMANILAISEVIISRAGASTLAEVTALGIPSILIPSPYVTNNHQEKNAQWIVDQGAAKMIREKDLNAKILLDTLFEVISNHKTISENAKRIGIVDSANIIYKEIENLIEG